VGQVIERDERGRVVLTQRGPQRVGLTVPGPDQVLMPSGEVLDRVRVSAVTRDRPVIMTIGTHKIGENFGVARVGLRSRNVVAVAITRRGERVDRVRLIAGRDQRLYPQTAIGLDPNDDRVRIVRVIGDELMERADPRQSLR